MTPKLSRLYDEAKSNVEFCAEFERIEKRKVPKWYNDDAVRIAFASIYWGYLIGKGDQTAIERWT